MPWCPNCGAEYREGFTECKECRVAPTNIEPCAQQKAGTVEAPDVFAGIEKPIAVYAASSQTEAELICEVLREQDIAAASRPTEVFAQLKAYGGSNARYGGEVLVDASQTARAREIIEEFKAGLEEQALDEEELARQAVEQPLDDPERLTEDNAAFKLLPVVAGVIALALVLLYFVAGR